MSSTPSGSPQPYRLAALALTFNALVWGLSWWPLRWLQDRGLHPLWATACIYLLCTLVVAAWRPATVLECLRYRPLWVVAIASGLTNACFNWAAAAGDVVRVVLLFYLMPLWAVLLARLLLGERAGIAGGLRVALAMVGAAVVLGAAPGRWPLPASAVEWLAVLGGFSFALNNVMLRREAQRSEAARTLAMFAGGTLLAAAAALLLPTEVVPRPALAAAHWPALLALAFVFLASNLALQYGAARLTANATAVIMITEVLFAGVSSWWLGASLLEPRVLVGGGLIVAAALLAAWSPAGRGAG